MRDESTGWLSWGVSLFAFLFLFYVLSAPPTMKHMIMNQAAYKAGTGFSWPMVYRLLIRVIESSVTPLPRLTIESQGTNVVVHWPVEAVGFTLESSDVLPGTNWSDVMGSVITNGADASVTVPATEQKIYYRLNGN